MLLTLLTALIILSVLILAHELGHFLVAKKAGIKVEEFGLGYPPRIWHREVKGTVYSLNLLPFGGFVKLYGEELDEKVDNPKLSFWHKSKKARMVVISAGVIANFFLAVLVFGFVYSKLGIPVQTGKVSVIGVMPQSPAEEAGLKENDVVLAVNQQSLSDLDQFVSLIEEKKGKETQFLIERGREKLALIITPRPEPPAEEGPLGVVVSDTKMVFYPGWQMPFRGAVEGFKEALNWAVLVVGGIGKMLGDLVTKGTVPKDVAGPIGILQITGMAAQAGFLSVLQFMGILSVNLAVLNFLPFPALDGGRFVLVVYEAITRRRPKPEFEKKINTAGFVFLMFLVVLVTINDLKRIWETASFASRLEKIWPF